MAGNPAVWKKAYLFAYEPTHTPYPERVEGTPYPERVEGYERTDTVPSTPSTDSPPSPPVYGGESGISPLRAGGAEGAALERLKRFRASASPTARELLLLLAAAPLSLPVMRLVQQTMLPASRSVHLAEVFLGDVLVRTTPANVNLHPEEVQYDFADGVRDILLESMTHSDRLLVLKCVSDYINRRAGHHPFDFRAFLAQAHSDEAINTISKEHMPFAVIATHVLRGMGGRYAELAESLEQVPVRIVLPPSVVVNGPPSLPQSLRTLLNEQHWEEALVVLEQHADNGNQEAMTLLASYPENADIPVDLRVRAARKLGAVGDPRPGVCTLPPPMMSIEGGTFIIGSTQEEAEEAGKAYEQYYLDKDDKKTAEKARTWPRDEINDQPVTVGTFELARYPVTNAHYQLFMDDKGYNPEQPWWDDAARAWLRRDDEKTEGLKEYQKRENKQQPKFWDDERFGKDLPNHPVVGVNWYEAMAFCRWLTQHTTYNPEGYTYCLPTEAEWEYAARGEQGRIYAWGDEQPDEERANFNQNHKGTTPVGCFPRGATPDTGLDDMTGNVWDWTRTVYRPYPYDADDGREDTSNPSEQTFCSRGGSWDNRSVFLRASLRLYNSPVDCLDDDGFRLARHLPQNMRSVF